MDNVLSAPTAASKQYKSTEYSSQYLGGRDQWGLDDFNGNGFRVDAEGSLGGRYRQLRSAAPASNYLVTGVTAATTAILALTSQHSPLATTQATDPSAYGQVFAPAKSPIALPWQFSEAMAEMREFGYLSAGWDGRGSVAPPIELIDEAIAFLRALPAEMLPPDASASADGTVMWYWDTPRLYASMSFMKAGYQIFYAKDKLSGDRFSSANMSREAVIPADFLDFLRAA